jgi:4-amino-4-deoxy-L-arabinose transferase-like glycosyltransferase
VRRILDRLSWAVDHPVMLLLAAAIAASLLMVWLTVPLEQLGRGDDRLYLAAASGLTHGCYCTDEGPVTFHPPGYAMFLALLGADASAALIAQLAIGAAVSVATFFLLAGEDRQLAFWTALALGISPFLIAYDLTVLSEALYVPLVWLAWLLLFRARQWRAALAAGALLGCALLTRNTLLLLPAALVLAARWPREWLRRSLIAAGVAYAMLLPWQLASAHGGRSHFGYDLWVGTWETDPAWMNQSIGNFGDYPAKAFTALDRRSAAAAFAAGDDPAFRRAALATMRDRPLGVLATWAVRWPRMWVGTRLEQIVLRPERWSWPWMAIKGVGFALNGVLLALGCAGMWLARRTPLAPFAVPVAYVAAIYLPFHNSEPRYSLLAVPFLTMFAVHAVLWWRARRGWRARRAPSRT